MNAFVGNISGHETRLAPAAHREWVPLPYMRRAVDFLKSHYVAGLPLRPGGRKTSITLCAFTELQQEGKARTMLVIAPLRVCRQVWRQEAAQWTQFRHLKFALLHGPKKLQALRSGADIYLINPEGVAWLCSQYMGRRLPFDVVAIDELTKFQNAQAERHKALRPRLKGVPYRWGLTGSLFAKGYMGIFGQQLILDDGAALGRYITHFRDKYFQVAFNGFDYDLLPGAEKRIIEKMAPYWFYVDESDYAQLPEIVDVPRIAEMSAKERAAYEKMKRDMILQLPEGEVTAANAGACYSKLAQMANGAVYLDDRSVAKIHDLKLDMIEELLDELNGEPLLVGYEFNHDLERIRERFGKDVPYLGKGTTAKQEDQWVAAWNRGEIPLMLAHPQSAGHGLNMQQGQARHVCWFSVTWDWENYDQFIRRVRRSGNNNAQVFNHILVVKGTLDEEKLAAIKDKDFTERRLTVALNKEILRDSQDQPEAGEKHMVAKLSRPDAGAAPAGWGAQPPAPPPQPAPAAPEPPQQMPGGWGAVAPDPNAEQRARIQEQIAPQPDRAAEAAAAFSGAIQQQTAAIQQADYGTLGASPNDRPPAGGWGAPAPQPAPPPQQSAPEPTPVAGWTGAPSQQPPFDPGNVETKPAEEEKPKRKTRSKKAEASAASEGSIELMSLRAQVLAAVLTSSPDLSTEEVVDTARDLMEFVERG